MMLSEDKSPDLGKAIDSFEKAVAVGSSDALVSLGTD